MRGLLMKYILYPHIHVYQLFIRDVSKKYSTCVYIFAPERSIGLCGV